MQRWRTLGHFFGISAPDLRLMSISHKLVGFGLAFFLVTGFAGCTGSYLSDGVLHLVMEGEGDDVKRKLGVVKMRHTNHMLGYKPFWWKEDEQRFSVL